jgi:hypothetical protein
VSSNPYPLRKVVRTEIDETLGKNVITLQMECGHATSRRVPPDDSGVVASMPIRVRCPFCPPRENAGSMKGRKRTRKAKARRLAIVRDPYDRLVRWIKRVYS